ncbi:MAG: glutathione S-transferase family protein [Deltaproteobacteria bacterium]|nr:glutathione S-transferase family protein [Deltaproteobacteria bacterium]
MKLYLTPPSPRAFKVIALKNHLGIECETQFVDLGNGDQLTPEYVAMNPNKKMPILEDDGFVLWESNAILFYLASKKPERGLWPTDLRRQADVLRWLAWESAHWDAESLGMVGYEKVSRVVLHRPGSADPALITRGEENFARFAEALDTSLKGRRWLVGETPTIAEFAIGAWIPVASRLELQIAKYPEIGRWYEGLAALCGWRESMVAR